MSAKETKHPQQSSTTAKTGEMTWKLEFSTEYKPNQTITIPATILGDASLLLKERKLGGCRSPELQPGCHTDQTFYRCTARLITPHMKIEDCDGRVKVAFANFDHFYSPHATPLRSDPVCSNIQSHSFQIADFDSAVKRLFSPESS